MKNSTSTPTVSPKTRQRLNLVVISDNKPGPAAIARALPLIAVVVAPAFKAAMELETVEIELTQGKVAIIDAADLPLVSGHRWCAIEGRKTFYAVTQIQKENGKQVLLPMHRLLLGAPGRAMVDHENGNGLDNRRKNIRLCSNQQNAFNSAIRLKGINRKTSQYKGVARANAGKWQSQITHNGQHIYLGRYSDEVEAAKVYDAKAKELFGQFANVNFP